MKTDKRIESALEQAEKKLNKTGTGTGSRTGKEYISALKELMFWFAGACPNIAINANPDNKFYKYAQIWFSLYAPLKKDGVRDIRRHIKNTLAHPMVDKAHVKAKK